MNIVKIGGKLLIALQLIGLVRKLLGDLKPTSATGRLAEAGPELVKRLDDVADGAGRASKALKGSADTLEGAAKLLKGLSAVAGAIWPERTNGDK